MGKIYIWSVRNAIVWIIETQGVKAVNRFFVSDDDILVVTTFQIEEIVI